MLEAFGREQGGSAYLGGGGGRGMEGVNILEGEDSSRARRLVASHSGDMEEEEDAREIEAFNSSLERYAEKEEREEREEGVESPAGSLCWFLERRGVARDEHDLRRRAAGLAGDREAESDDEQNLNLRRRAAGLSEERKTERETHMRSGLSGISLSHTLSHAHTQCSGLSEERET